MIADRQGPLPQDIAHSRNIAHKRVRFAGCARPQSDYSAVGRAYLLLIDRENPLSSPCWRR
jgi:hypothetical protein